MVEQVEMRDGMCIEWDVVIQVDDGTVLRADVFRPLDDGQHPVLLSYGPYAKGLAFQEGYADSWNLMVERYPDTCAGSTNKYQAWEVVDPEKWVPDGYACVRVDGRGWGRSPGYIEPFSPREARDLYECIEWAGTRPWSNGRVGLAGISYYAINQWQVAGLQPPHLAAMVPWEGKGDFYRDWSHHGGILCTSVDVWYGRVIASVQHGRGSRRGVNPNTGELYTGPDTLSDDELAVNRCDFTGDVRKHELDDEFYRERSAAWSDIVVPFLAAGNWGGHGLHLRGATEGFLRAASPQKWLEIHGGEHWTGFYTDYGVALQKRFFDHFLKGLDNGWADQPAVHLRVRHVDGTFVDRDEHEWPLARTQWTRRFLNPAAMALDDEPAVADAVTFDALGDGVTFWTPPLEAQTEITGPVAARLFVSSNTTDADVFLVLRVFDPQDREVVFQGAVDPHKPVALGWLRASHRKLDDELSREYRPYHPHDEVEPLTPGEIYQLDVEIWPTSVVVPAGYRVALTVRGKDYEYPGEPLQLDHFGDTKLRGVGIYRHDDPDDRPPDVYGGTTTVHCGPTHPSSILLPVVPPR